MEAQRVPTLGTETRISEECAGDVAGDARIVTIWNSRVHSNFITRIVKSDIRLWGLLGVCTNNAKGTCPMTSQCVTESETTRWLIVYEQTIFKHAFHSEWGATRSRKF